MGREGAYQIQGVATVFFGNTIPCQASRLTLKLSAGIGLILKERWTGRMRGAVVPVKGTLLINKLRAFPALSFSLYLVAAKP